MGASYQRPEQYGSGDMISGFRKEDLRVRDTTVIAVQTVEKVEEIYYSK